MSRVHQSLGKIWRIYSCYRGFPIACLWRQVDARRFHGRCRKVKLIFRDFIEIKRFRRLSRRRTSDYNDDNRNFIETRIFCEDLKGKHNQNVTTTGCREFSEGNSLESLSNIFSSTILGCKGNWKKLNLSENTRGRLSRDVGVWLWDHV